MNRIVLARPLLLGLAVLAAAAGAAQAAPAPRIAQGRALLQANCGRCHSLGVKGSSPLRAAPPFRTLGRRYPVEDLEEALGEGILVGHSPMPQFSFTDEQVADIIAFLKSIQR